MSNEGKLKRNFKEKKEGYILNSSRSGQIEDSGQGGKQFCGGSKAKMNMKREEKEISVSEGKKDTRV